MNRQRNVKVWLKNPILDNETTHEIYKDVVLSQVDGYGHTLTIEVENNKFVTYPMHRIIKIETEEV